MARLSVTFPHTCDLPGRGLAQVKTSKGPHNIFLSGVFVGGVSVLVRGLMQFSENQMVFRICVRSPNPEVSQMVADCIR